MFRLRFSKQKPAPQANTNGHTPAVTESAAATTPPVTANSLPQLPAATTPPATPATPPRALPTSLVERDKEMERLNLYWKQVVDGHGKVVLLSGEAGNGKSSLADAFIQSVQTSGNTFKVARAACSAQSGRDEPFWPFADVIGQLAKTGSNKKVAGDILDAVLDLAPSWASVIPVAGTVVGASIKTAQVVRTRTRVTDLPNPDKLLREYVGALQKVADKQPVLVFIDDLHWSDAGSIRLLSHLSRNIASMRVLVVIAYRPSDLAVEGHPLHELINELLRYDTDIEIVLPPLTQEGTQALVNRLYPANKYPAELANTLYASTGGSPLFIVESMRLMQSREQVMKDPQDGKWMLKRELNDEDLPRSVEAVIRKRMERMPKDLQEALALAAVQGKTFESAVLAHVLGQDELAVMKLLEPAEKVHDIIDYAGDVELAEDTTSRYRFTNSMIQRELLESLRGKQLLIAHRKTAEGLEKLWADDIEDLAPKLALHYEKGKLWDKAAYFNILAGKQARRAGSVAQAIALFENAEHLFNKCGIQDPAQQFEIDENLSYLYELDSSYDKAEARTRRALTAGFVVLGWRKYAVLQMRLAKLADNAGRLQESLDILQATRSMLSKATPEDATSRQAFELLSETAQALTRVSRADEGTRAAEEALELLSRQPQNEETQLLRMRLMMALAESHGSQGNYKQVINIFEEVCSNARKLNDMDVLPEVLVNLSQTYLILGQYDKAREYIKVMIDTAQQISSESLLASAYVVAARAQIYQAKPFAALRQLDEAEKLVNQSRFLSARPQLLGLRAVALINLGRGDEAQPILNEARTVAQASGSREWVAMVDMFQAMLAVTRHDGLKALSLAQSAVQVFTEEGARFEQAIALRAVGSAYREMGQLRLAKKAFDDAKTIFDAIGNQQQASRTVEEANK
jgi:tetratricopeptide (TPR) repeat protein